MPPYASIYPRPGILASINVNSSYDEEIASSWGAKAMSEDEMRILVTGAAGFVGRRVVSVLLALGHDVRCLVRSSLTPAAWHGTAELFQCDLARHDLSKALAGIDVVIHLAGHSSNVNGSEAAVRGTGRLCEAIAVSEVRRFCHVSSLAVYDWASTESVLDEQSRLAKIEEAPTEYAKSKVRQEELVKNLSRPEVAITIVRPGFIWGPGRLWVDGVGRRLPGAYLLVAPEAEVPLTHVDNCADAIVSAALHGDGVFNIVDQPSISRRQYLQTYIAGAGKPGIVVSMSYLTGLKLVTWLQKCLRGRLGVKRLPSLIDPERFEGQFKPVVVSAEKINRELGWMPPLDFRSATDRSFANPD